MKVKLFFLVMVALFIISLPVVADTIIVDPNGSADYTTIQDGIDYSCDGDTVVVRPATYNEQIHFNKKIIELKSTDPTDPCIVEATIIIGRVTFNFYEQQDSIINGFYVQGGIYCNESYPTIKNNIITNSSGSGIWSEHDSPTIIDNWIKNCSQYGIRNCEGLIQGNKITNNSYGINSCDGEIKDNIIVGNSYRGLISCGGLIKNNFISSNQDGGLYGCWGTIESNIISDNFSNSNGGGLELCEGIIKNNIISGNIAAVGIGGGLNRCKGTIISNTIVGNSARYGSAISKGNSIPPDIFKNNIITFNMATEINGGAVYDLVYDEGYNCYWQNTNGNFGGTSYGIATDYYFDPWFAVDGYWTDPCNTPSDLTDDEWVDGDYHLKSEYGRYDPNIVSWVNDAVTSHCIDAGDPADGIDQEPNPNGGRINVGAYGGTMYASKSETSGTEPEPDCTTPPSMDTNDDCQIDFTDFAVFAGEWLNCGYANQDDCWE